jgi:ABC-2 type transport system ATP-binding protein
MIEAAGLVKRFGDFTAVDGVSLRIVAGKLTLLKLMTGLLPPDSGSTRICGLDVRLHPMEVRRRIGVMPEDLGLFDSLTVEEHLELCGSVYSLDRKEARSRALDLLRVLRLEHARDVFLDQCSHGMRKKIALAFGHHASIIHPAPLRAWRFSGDRVYIGVIQGVAGIVLGFAAGERVVAFLAASGALYLVSLFVYGWLWDRRG